MKSEDYWIQRNVWIGLPEFVWEWTAKIFNICKISSMEQCKKGLKISSCECTCASREISESYWPICMLKCEVTQWQTALKAWVAIRN